MFNLGYGPLLIKIKKHNGESERIEILAEYSTDRFHYL
jgi:hypothetical protein